MSANGSQVVRSDGPTLTRVFTPSPLKVVVVVVENKHDPIAPTLDCRNDRGKQPWTLPERWTHRRAHRPLENHGTVFHKRPQATFLLSGTNNDQTDRSFLRLRLDTD